MAEHHHAMTEAERAEHDELATTYATLLLHDAGVEITVFFKLLFLAFHCYFAFF